MLSFSSMDIIIPGKSGPNNQPNSPYSPNPSPPGTDPSEPTEPLATKSSNRDLFSTLAILIAAPLIAFFLTVFVFQSYEVDGPSMETTLQDKDRLIVVKLQKSWSKLVRKDYIPDRYSVIVFDYNGTLHSGENRQLIKRIIGVPGDRVVIKDGVVTIYNKDNPNGFNPDKQGPHAPSIKETSGNYDETVADGEVFVLGDNRDNSLDSRAFGPIRSSDIVGKLSTRIYPLDAIKRY